MTYCVDLSDNYVKDCPQWYRNIWSACATFAAIEAELQKFKGVYKHSVQSGKVSTKHYIEFESEADYVFCLLRWS